MFTVITARLDALRARYAEPHRAYHTLAHIHAMLAGWRDIGDGWRHRDAVELATWYHDAIYDPAATDNEARSAALLRAELGGIADPVVLERAALLILATADHVVPPNCPPDLQGDAELFLDLDMAILGADRATFLAYEEAIATEYVPVHGLEQYRVGRVAFLQSMLESPRLFLSEGFHQRLDRAARLNMAAVIEITGPGDRLE